MQFSVVHDLHSCPSRGAQSGSPSAVSRKASKSAGEPGQTARSRSCHVHTHRRVTRRYLLRCERITALPDTASPAVPANRRYSFPFIARRRPTKWRLNRVRPLRGLCPYVAFPTNSRDASLAMQRSTRRSCRVSVRRPSTRELSSSRSTAARSCRTSSMA